MAVTSFVVQGGVIAKSCSAYDLSQADRGETGMPLLWWPDGEPAPSPGVSCRPAKPVPCPAS